MGVENGERRLETDDAHGAPGEALGLFLRAVRRVVGCDHVHRAVEDALEQRVPVGLRAQGRVHLEAAVLAQVVLGQHEVVRRGLAGDVQPLRLRPADKRHALLGGHVAHMIGAACLAHQLEIALQLPPLALTADALVPVGAGIRTVVDIAAVQEGVVLAVRGNDLAEACRLAHRGAHHIRILHAAAVVGKAGDVRRELLHVRKLPAAAVRGDRAVGRHVDDRIRADALQLRGKRLQTVRRRIQIGHGTHAAVSAVRRSKRAGRNGLLIRKTRLTEMYMHIYETR